MAICSLGHEHPDESPAEVVPVPVESGPNENDVKIAEIEAAASIKREEIWTEQQALALEADRDELRGEIRGMREVLDRLVPPEPEAPESVVVPVPDAPPSDPPAESIPDAEKTPSKKKNNGWWSDYS